MDAPISMTGRGPEQAFGMPVTQHNAYSPVGQIEQWGLFAAGLRRQRGWRRVLAIVVVLFLLLAPLVTGVSLAVIR